MSSTSLVGGFPIAKNPNDPFLTQTDVDRLGNGLEGLLAGLASVSVAGGGNVTLDTALDESPVAVAFRPLVFLTGTLTASINVILPAWAGKWWYVYNGSAGAYTITVKTASGTGVVVTQGYGAFLYSDGTNILRLSADMAAVSDLVATLVATQTLLNKTLTSPALGTSVLDTNGNVLLALSIAASAVNRVQLGNAATGNPPSLEAVGSDTNIDLLLAAKGTGALRIGSPMLGNGVAMSRGYVSIADSDATLTPSSAQYSNRILEITGALTANRNVDLPNTQGAEFVVANLTTGGFSLTFLVSGQTGVAVANGKRAVVYCNGTDYVRVTPDT